MRTAWGQEGNSGARNRNRRSHDELRLPCSEQERRHLESSAGVAAQDAEDGYRYHVIHGSGYIPEEGSESEAGIGSDTDDMRESRDVRNEYRGGPDSDGQDPESRHWRQDANDERLAATRKVRKAATVV